MIESTQKFTLDIIAMVVGKTKIFRFAQPRNHFLFVGRKAYTERGVMGFVLY
jgi:hypothetical protein